MGYEENEISANAFGGTEITKRKLGALIDADLLNNFQIICSRPRELEQNKIRMFWCHDLPSDPESARFKDENFLNSIHKFIFVSNWQYEQYRLFHDLPYDNKSIIIENWVDPAPDERVNLNAPSDGKIRIVYTSTPQRGLEILVPVFEKLAEIHPEIHLDVFSSFKIYGWDEADKKYEQLYNRCRNHPQITYHGFVPHEQLLEHLNKSHIFAYPSIWQETSCRALIESMSAGLICVHPNYGALPDTSGSLNIMYHGHHDMNVHANIFASYLDAAIKLYKMNDHRNIVNYNKFYIDSRFGFNRIKNMWESLLNATLKQYPTEESRKIIEEMFVYKTV